MTLEVERNFDIGSLIQNADTDLLFKSVPALLKFFKKIIFNPEVPPTHPSAWVYKRNIPEPYRNDFLSKTWPDP